jgi:hypothetical protein
MQDSWFAAAYIMRDRGRIVRPATIKHPALRRRIPQPHFAWRYCGSLACAAM